MDRLKREGRNLLGMLNDLKRDSATAAKELGIPVKELSLYIEGGAEIPAALIKKAAEIWPVNIRDFYGFEDDAPEGVLVMTKEESERSSRTLKRGGADYYEYRDTAMSRSALFRPEWIQELVVAGDNNPFNKELAWNNGHLLHQFTYFVGDVNFYYDIDGERFCADMSTGDSMYIAPYVPHTFATRRNREGKLGLIIAVTFGGKLMGDAQQELSVLGREKARDLLLDYSSRSKACGSLIKDFREQLSMDAGFLAARSSITLERFSALETGDEFPTEEEIDRISSALSISARDLMPIENDVRRVVVLKHENTRSWDYENYKFTELAHTARMPYMKALELVIRNRSAARTLKTTSHQYGYNIGNTDIDLTGEYDRIIRPGDSFYVKPNVKHAYISDKGRLLVVRIGGRLSGDAQHELSLLDRRGLDRVVGESIQWYDPKGRR